MVEIDEVHVIELAVDGEIPDDIPTEALLALAFALNPDRALRVLRSAVEEGHWHKCGHGGIGQANIHHEGCGHIWKHESVPEEQYAAGHTCPRCHMGPWFIKFAKEDGTLIVPRE